MLNATTQRGVESVSIRERTLTVSSGTDIEVHEGWVGGEAECDLVGSKHTSEWNGPNCRDDKADDAPSNDSWIALRSDGCPRTWTLVHNLVSPVSVATWIRAVREGQQTAAGRYQNGTVIGQFSHQIYGLYVYINFSTYPVMVKGPASSGDNHSSASAFTCPSLQWCWRLFTTLTSMQLEFMRW